MQNRDVGEIGDYLKLGILVRCHPDNASVSHGGYPQTRATNRDGRHIGYLHRPDQRRHYDPKLFDALAQIVSTGHRDIRALMRSVFFPEQSIPSEMLSIGGQRSAACRRAAPSPPAIASKSTRGLQALPTEVGASNKGAKGLPSIGGVRTPRSRESGPYVTLSASSNISSVKFSTQSAKTSRIGWVLRNERPEMLIPTVTLLPRASRMKRYSPKGSH